MIEESLWVLPNIGMSRIGDNMNNEIVLFETKDSSITLPVQMANDTVLLTANQMALLFDKDEKTVRKHVNNVFSDGELERNNNTQKMRVVGVKQPVPFYTLDVIISVGYRVKSQRGVEFRRWANSVLKQYILEGYAVNQKRISDLGKVVRLLKRTEHSLDAHQVLAVVEKYSEALTLLDSYDHQNMVRPKGNAATYILTYEECRNVIESLRFGSESALFGNEKDDSFKGSIGNIYQSFDGKDLYPSLEEKAANLLYFVTKNHSFTDGNKRIAATMFLYFLDRNGILFADEVKLIDDLTLVALTIMIAESRPEEKEMMVSVIMNCLK
jgi:prophage maintenance system killer protein